MTTWISALMDRRSPSTRHWGAPADADLMRMAHELSLMDQGSKAERIARAARTATPRRHAHGTERVSGHHHSTLTPR